jgi:membrane protein implicated in regulation of membrane protease activity
MADELTEVERQVLSAARDERLPTNDVALAEVTGLDRDVVRAALVRLGEDYLRVTPHHDVPVSERVEVVGVKGDGGLTRPVSGG